MKKILKKEVIISFIVGIILASSIAVYAAAINAKDVDYTKPGTTTAISVETALNELYSKKSTTKGTEWNCGTLLAVKGDNNIDVGFVPSRIVFTLSTDGTTCVYNSDKSTTQTYTCHASAIATFPLNSDSTSSSHIKSIGTTTVFKGYADGATGYWFAVK